MCVLLGVAFGAGIYVGYFVQSKVCEYFLYDLNESASRKIETILRSRRERYEI